MTYLNPIRLHFAGQFQADPSTVNNDIRHFDTSEFKPGWQQLSTGQANPNGWWNPDGSGSFRLVGCTVTSVGYLDGTKAVTSTTDSIVGKQIMGANVCAQAIRWCQQANGFSKRFFCIWIFQIDRFEELTEHHVCFSLPNDIALLASCQCLFDIGLCLLVF